MSEREKLTAPEIEALCVDALRKLPGLQTIQYAKIRPYKGDGSRTWELEADPSLGALALAGAEPVIYKLQSDFDLKGDDDDDDNEDEDEDEGHEAAGDAALETEPFKIENESQAEAHLKDFLATPENRSMEAVEQEARQCIDGDSVLRMYFMDMAREQLEGQ